MASIPTQYRADLIALFNGMFNAAPGISHLGSLMRMYESGKTIANIAGILGARPEFSRVYPATLSNDEFVARLALNLLGNEVDAAAKQWAIEWAKGQLLAGKDRPTTIATALQALKYSINPGFDNAKQMLFNKVDVATYYSITREMGVAVALEDLQKVIEGVTSDMSSVVRAKVQIGAPVADPVGRVYTLTTASDVITSGASFDIFVANGAGTLSASDTIDGGAGQDAINIYDATNRIDIPAGITVRNVETANIVATAGMAADTVGWTGLTALNLTSFTGGVSVTAANTTSIVVTVGGVINSAPTTEVMIDVAGGSTLTITTNSNVLAIINNPRAGMTLGFSEAAGAATFSSGSLSLSADATLQNYLDAAAASGGSPNTKVTWFQYLGNTYVVEDNSATASYVAGIDTTVKLVGLVDLSTAAFAAVANVSASLTLA